MATGLPERVRRWCAEVLGGDVADARPIVGGITDAIWRLEPAAGDPVVLRWVDPTHPYAADGRTWVLREAVGCRLTHGTAVPSPELLASDPDGQGTGGWANLTTFLPGRVRLDRLGPTALDALAGLAVAVHDVVVPDDARPPAYDPWLPRELGVPAWARRPALWEEAIAIATGPAPATPQHLIHRDFHPGNTLWEGDVVTGLVDWAETSWGPADLDVAHACANFAMLHSVADALAFRSAYERRGGRLDPDPAAWRYWSCLDIAGFLPGPSGILVALTRQRPDLDADGVRTRLEDLLALTLGRPERLGP